MNRLGSRILDKMQNILSVLRSYVVIVVIVVIFVENPLLSTNPQIPLLITFGVQPGIVLVSSSSTVLSFLI